VERWAASMGRTAATIIVSQKYAYQGRNRVNIFVAHEKSEIDSYQVHFVDFF
jgi:hypothetical protein